MKPKVSRSDHVRTRVGERWRAYVLAVHGVGRAIGEIRDDGDDGPPRDERFVGGISTHTLVRLTADALDTIDQALSDLWERDRWEVRLSKFSAKLTRSDLTAFRALVSRGCQPDLLAHELYCSVTLPVAVTLLNEGKEAEKLATLLESAAARASMLRVYTVRHGLAGIIPDKYPDRLRRMGRSIRPPAECVSSADLRHAALRRAVDHIARVTGRHHYDLVRDVVNGLRADAGKEPVTTWAVTQNVARGRQGGRRLAVHLRQRRIVQPARRMLWCARKCAQQ